MARGFGTWKEGGARAPESGPGTLPWVGAGEGAALGSPRGFSSPPPQEPRAPPSVCPKGKERVGSMGEGGDPWVVGDSPVAPAPLPKLRDRLSGDEHTDRSFSTALHLAAIGRLCEKCEWTAPPRPRLLVPVEPARGHWVDGPGGTWTQCQTASRSPPQHPIPICIVLQNYLVGVAGPRVAGVRRALKSPPDTRKAVVGVWRKHTSSGQENGSQRFHSWSAARHCPKLRPLVDLMDTR